MSAAKVPALQRDDMEKLLDFVVRLAERIQVCGGEFWRTEETIRAIFRAYRINDVEVFSLTHLLIVSIRAEGEEQLSRHISIGDTAVDLEQLTNLSRLIKLICALRPAPAALPALLEEASHGHGYSFPVFAAGMMLAIVTLCRIFGGGLNEWIVSGLGILLVLGIQKLLTRTFPGSNAMVSNILCTFVVGALTILCSGIFTLDPYIVMISVAFGLMPGVPLINSFRELLCGRIMTGTFLLLQVLMETMAVVGGYYLSLQIFMR